MASAILSENLRIVRRCQCLTSDVISVLPTRPSILDYNLRGDLWIAFGPSSSLTLFLGKQPLVRLAGTRLDSVALNSRLLELRQGKPRRNCRT